MLSLKKFIFILISIFLILILALFLNFFSKKFLKNNYGDLYSTKTIEIHKKYLNKVHHLRNPFKFRDKELIFTKIGSSKTKILIQGDSWAEQFLNDVSKNEIIKFAKKNDLEFLIAGTSSYSPSLYNAQLDIILNNLSIEPKVIIVVIDQTDIGDELCRYKEQLIKKDNKIYVLPYDDPSQGITYNLNSTLRRIEILTSNQFSLIKFLKISKIKIKDLYNEKKYKDLCIFNKDILGPLERGIESNDKVYLEKIIKNYFNNIFKIKDLSKLIVVTHPHLSHLDKVFTYNINKILNDLINKNKDKDKIVFLNFEKELKNYLINNSLENVYKKNDPASHLTNKYHGKIFTKKILDKILN